MDQSNKKRRRSTPPTCKRCGNNQHMRRILYGYPGPDLSELARRGTIVLGGCMVGDKMPEWSCAGCGREYGRKPISEHAPFVFPSQRDPGNPPYWRWGIVPEDSDYITLAYFDRSGEPEPILRMISDGREGLVIEVVVENKDQRGLAMAEKAVQTLNFTLTEWPLREPTAWGTLLRQLPHESNKYGPLRFVAKAAPSRESRS